MISKCTHLNDVIKKDLVELHTTHKQYATSSPNFKNWMNWYCKQSEFKLLMKDVKDKYCTSECVDRNTCNITEDYSQ